MGNRTAWTSDIASAAARERIDPILVEAVVIIESGGNPYAWNPEPHYRYLVDVRTGQPFRELTVSERATEVPPADFPTLAGDRDQEWWGQQASWGLMQIMGALAREIGFRGLYLPELTRPHLNLQLGCQHLANLLRWSNGDERRAVAAYNAGRGGWNGPAGQAYQQKVFAMRARVAAP
jgi:soluble lytic murein transglycosylase-like protein